MGYTIPAKKEKIDDYYTTKYAVLNGATFDSITTYQEEAVTAFTALSSNLEGLKGALGKESTWDDNSCSSLIESFESSATEIKNGQIAIEAKCPPAKAALTALAEAIVLYHDTYDEYDEAYEEFKSYATSYNMRENSEPPAYYDKKTYDSEGNCTGSVKTETEYHKNWREELESYKEKADPAQTKLNELETKLTTCETDSAAAVTSAKAACS
jgi:chromosome segregation ATPase